MGAASILLFVTHIMKTTLPHTTTRTSWTLWIYPVDPQGQDCVLALVLNYLLQYISIQVQFFLLVSM